MCDTWQIRDTRRREKAGGRQPAGPVRLKLLVYELTEAGARAKEAEARAAKENARKDAEHARQLAKARAEADAMARANEKAAKAKEAAIRDEAKRVMSVYVRTLTLYAPDALDCRRLKIEVDFMGLNKMGGGGGADHPPPPLALSPPLSVRSAQATRGELAVDFMQKLHLAPNSHARATLRAALVSETLEDSDVFLVLHGLGGSGTSRDGREIATAVVNLEELLEAASDLRDVWLDLRAGPTEPPLGRVQVSVTALDTLREVKKEAEDAPPPPPPPPLPDGPARWRLGLGVDGVILRAYPHAPCYYALHLYANGEAISHMHPPYHPVLTRGMPPVTRGR